MTGVDPLPWLLEPENPSARYLTLTRLLDRPEDDLEVQEARAAIPGWGPARAILDAQWPEGYWMAPGIGYSPKHKATVWQAIFLAALGAPRIPEIERACAYILDHGRLPDGRFSAFKTAKGAIACLNGNLLRSILQFGIQDPRMDQSLEALAEMLLRDGFRCRYNSPRPALARNGLPCAWGLIKALGAFAEMPGAQRSPTVREATEAGVSFLVQHDLAAGDFPTATKPSRLWQAFGFPLDYTSDLVEGLEVLGRLGVRGDPRLAAAIAVVRSKQDNVGRWALEYTPDNTWATFGELGQPNKWVTLRALGALKGMVQ